jgi:hypothetical protein
MGGMASRHTVEHENDVILHGVDHEQFVMSVNIRNSERVSFQGRDYLYDSGLTSKANTHVSSALIP